MFDLSPITGTCHLSPTETATDPPSAKSANMNRKLIHQDRTKTHKQKFSTQFFFSDGQKILPSSI